MIAEVVFAFQLILAADEIPKLDVTGSCRAGTGTDAGYQSCLRDEKAAEEELTKNWAQFSKLDKPMCIAQSKAATSSYVTLLTCLQMARDARVLRKTRRNSGAESRVAPMAAA